jgi:hypothetical protein
MSVEVGLNIGLGSCGRSVIISTIFTFQHAKGHGLYRDGVYSPFRGRLPRYNLVDDTSVMVVLPPRILHEAGETVAKSEERSGWEERAKYVCRSGRRKMQEGNVLLCATKKEALHNAS